LTTLNVHFLPQSATPEALHGATAVVIDVLRATTTIVYALAAGARGVTPCLTIEEARRAALSLPAGQAIIAGERGGLPIKGFDLGNSPGEFTSEIVRGKQVVLTTTNGTKALLHCGASVKILLAAFVNLSALCAQLLSAAKVEVVCAGTDGHITREDVLVAGAIAQAMADAQNRRLNDEARIARDAWLAIAAGAEAEDLEPRIVDALGASQGGANLIAIGMREDLQWAAKVDRFAIVPRFDAATGLIQAAPPSPAP
jgi:2-phosphosulfolactate phosphatase